MKICNKDSELECSPTVVQRERERDRDRERETERERERERERETLLSRPLTCRGTM